MKTLNIKSLTVIIAIVFFTVSTKAQQDPQYTQYVYNMNIINPAYAGSYDVLSLNFLARTQWVGIDGAPQTLTVGAHTPIGKNVGVGLSLVADKLGPVEEKNVYGDFSYPVNVSETAKLAFGLKAGFTFFDAILTDLQTSVGNDPLFANNINKILPNFGVGAFYHTEKFYAGISIPNLLETFHFEKKGGQISKATDINHYFIASGYVFDISRDLKLKPSVMLKAAPGAPLSIDFSGNILFKEKVEFGLSYRLDESVSALINLRASRSFRIGYAYDHTLTNFGNFNSGSHEIFMLFNFDFERSRIRSPRFF